MLFSTGSLKLQREQLEQSIRDMKKADPTFKVIDVGGSAALFDKSVYDYVVDINAENSNDSFKVDICNINEWDIVIDHVSKNGKFDFCICSHTLEDVYNPYISLEIFPKIAKAGCIMVPNYTTELSNIESNSWLGYCHHRYIYKEKNGKLLVIPKMPFLENMIRHNDKELINFMVLWRDRIDYEVFMGNYLGPDVSTVVKSFSNELK